MGAPTLRAVTYSWLGQLLDPLHFFVGDDVKEADDVGVVPLILLLDRCQHIHGVVMVVKVTTEEPAQPAGGLIGRRGTKEVRLMRLH